MCLNCKDLASLKRPVTLHNIEPKLYPSDTSFVLLFCDPLTCIHNNSQYILLLLVSEFIQNLKWLQKLFLTLQVQPLHDKWRVTLHITNTADGGEQIQLISTVAPLVTAFAACFIINYGGWLVLCVSRGDNRSVCIVCVFVRLCLCVKAVCHSQAQPLFI